MRARTRWLYHTLSLRWYRPKSSGFRAIDFRIESGTSYSVYGRGIESDFNLFRSIYPLGFWVRLVSSGVGDQTNTITCNVIFWWFSFGVDLPADDCSSATVFINWKQTSDTHGFVFDLLHFICNSYMWFYFFFFRQTCRKVLFDFDDFEILCRKNRFDILNFFLYVNFALIFEIFRKKYCYCYV